MIELRKMLYLWEQFKEEAHKAVTQSQSTGTKWHLVFVPSLKQFDATNNPHPADEIITTYGDKDDIYSPQTVEHENPITTFEVWIRYNGHRLEADRNSKQDLKRRADR